MHALLEEYQELNSQVAKLMTGKTYPLFWDIMEFILGAVDILKIANMDEQELEKYASEIEPIFEKQGLCKSLTLTNIKASPTAKHAVKTYKFRIMNATDQYIQNEVFSPQK
jgi:hypothetical protein